MNSKIENLVSELKDGEIYAGAITSPDGIENHIVLLPNQHQSINYPDAVIWAAKKGGCLPTQAELNHIFSMARAAKRLGNTFHDFGDTFFFWSSDQYAVHSGGAPSTLHLSGRYQPGIEGTYIRACAIRRVAL